MPPRKKTVKTHPCGLPESLMKDKAKIVEYTDLHLGDHGDMRSRMVITGAERQAYKRYKAAMGRTAPASTKRFVAALRLWAKEYPLQPVSRPDINAKDMQITS